MTKYFLEKNLNEHKKVVVHCSVETIKILIPYFICSFIATYKIVYEHYLKEHNPSIMKYRKIRI